MRFKRNKPNYCAACKALNEYGDLSNNGGKKFRHTCNKFKITKYTDTTKITKQNQKQHLK